MAGVRAETYAIFEWNPNGHRLMYVGRLIREAAAIGRDVSFITTSDVARSPEYQEFVAPVVQSFAVPVREVDSSLAPSLRAVKVLQALSRGRTLVFSDGDRWLPVLTVAWSWRQPAILLMMRVGRRDGSRHWHNAIKLGAVVALSRLKNVRVRRLSGPLDDSDEGIARGWRRIAPVNDPLPEMRHTSRADARVRMGLPGEARILLIAGSIDMRKSVAQVIEWLVSRNESDRLVLVLAGRLAPPVRHLFRQLSTLNMICQGLIVVHDRFLPDNELADCYLASDVVLILNENEGPSGALAHAAVAGRPVIAWGSRAVVQTVITHRLGVVAAGRDPASLDQALSELNEQSPAIAERRVQTSIDGGRFATQLLLSGEL